MNYVHLCFRYHSTRIISSW